MPRPRAGTALVQLARMRNLLLILLGACLPTVAHAQLELTPRMGVFAVLDNEGAAAVPFTLGVAVQPTGRHQVTGFLAPQIDIDLSGPAASYAPTARLGLLVRDREDTWMSSFMSWVRVYGIVGYRLPGAGRSGLRTGVGLDSGMGLLLTAVGLKSGVPIPNAIEVIWEGVDGDEGSVALHLGIAI